MLSICIFFFSTLSRPNGELKNMTLANQPSDPPTIRLIRFRQNRVIYSIKVNHIRYSDEHFYSTVAVCEFGTRLFFLVYLRANWSCFIVSKNCDWSTICLKLLRKFLYNLLLMRIDHLKITKIMTKYSNETA